LGPGRPRASSRSRRASRRRPTRRLPPPVRTTGSGTVVPSMSLAEKAGAGPASIGRPIPPFTEEHEEFRAAVRRFVENELFPHSREWEEARWFPGEVFGRLAELGYIGLKFPPQYGGDGDP